MTQSNVLQHSGIQSEETFGRKLSISKFFNSPGSDIFVESLLPGFVREEHQRFVDFLKAYYQWLDQNNNIGEKIRRIKQQQDIDLADPEFAEHFYREFLDNIPRNVLTDKKILVKYIKHFYRTKGTEKSYKFFFRMLFDTDVDFYYPSRDILKVSDGKWVREHCLRVIPLVGEAKDFYNKKIIGKDNGITAYVTYVRQIKSQNYFGLELVVNTSSISGRFNSDEVIQTEDGSFFARISPIPTSYEFQYDTSSQQYKMGTGYKVGDTFKIINQTGRDGRIAVTSIVPTQRTVQGTTTTPPPAAQDLEAREDSVRMIFLGTKPIVSIKNVVYADDGREYKYEPTRGTAGIDINGVNHVNVRGWYVLSEDNLGNIYLRLQPNYPSPSGRVRVEFEYLVEEESGSIEKLQIVNFGLEYRTYSNETKKSFVTQLNNDTCVTKNFTGSGIDLTINTGAFAVYPGYYTNDDGHLSSSKKLQDGEYYQNYSYVLITNQSTSLYEDSLKKLIHPAGLKFFGKYRQQSLVSASVKTTGNSIVRREFKQFPRPTLPGWNPPFRKEPFVETNVSITSHSVHDRYSPTFGPSRRSIFRERFDYAPTEKYNSTKDFRGFVIDEVAYEINGRYWEDQQVLGQTPQDSRLIAAVANTSIDKFMHVIPIALEGVTESQLADLPKIPDQAKTGNYQSRNRGDLIYNTTKRLVEMYDDENETWIEINPNMRINIVPDAVVTTTQPLINENGDVTLKLTSTRTLEKVGNHKITVL